MEKEWGFDLEKFYLESPKFQKILIAFYIAFCICIFIIVILYIAPWSEEEKHVGTPSSFLKENSLSIPKISPSPLVDKILKKGVHDNTK